MAQTQQATEAPTEAPVPTPIVPIPVESPWSVAAYNQLSRRVDDTHGLVVELATQFASHRQETAQQLTKVVEGIASISAKQAAEDRAVERLADEKGRKIASKSNWLNRVLIVVTGASVITGALAVLIHP